MQFINVPMTSLMRGILRKKASLDFPSIRYFSPFHSIFVLFLPCYNGQLSLAPTITSMNAWQLKILSLSLSLGITHFSRPNRAQHASSEEWTAHWRIGANSEFLFPNSAHVPQLLHSLTEREESPASSIAVRAKKGKDPPKEGTPEKSPLHWGRVSLETAGFSGGRPIIPGVQESKRTQVSRLSPPSPFFLSFFPLGESKPVSRVWEESI